VTKAETVSVPLRLSMTLGLNSLPPTAASLKLSAGATDRRPHAASARHHAARPARAFDESWKWGRAVYVDDVKQPAVSQWLWHAANATVMVSQFFLQTFLMA